MKLLRVIARDLLVGVLAIGIFWMGLRVYVGYKIEVAQSAARDFQELIIAEANRQQVAAYLAKYRSHQTENDVVIFPSPTIYLLPRPDAVGNCVNDRLENNLFTAFLQQVMFRVGRSVGFSCYRLGVLVAVDSDGKLTGMLDYRPMRGRSVTLFANGANTKLPRSTQYAICESNRWGETIVRVYPSTAKPVSSAISAIDVRCFRKYDGCSFQEILPAAALQRESDMSRGVDPCY